MENASGQCGGPPNGTYGQGRISSFRYLRSHRHDVFRRKVALTFDETITPASPLGWNGNVLVLSAPNRCQCFPDMFPRDLLTHIIHLGLPGWMLMPSRHCSVRCKKSSNASTPIACKIVSRSSANCFSRRTISGSMCISMSRFPTRLAARRGEEAAPGIGIGLRVTGRAMYGRGHLVDLCLAAHTGLSPSLRGVYSSGTTAARLTMLPSLPMADAIDGIPPAIAIDQTNPVRTSRSTVGTMTELNDHLKLLFARAAVLHCRGCGAPVRRDTPGSILDALRAAGLDRVMVSFEVADSRGVHFGRDRRAAREPGLHPGAPRAPGPHRGHPGPLPARRWWGHPLRRTWPLGQERPLRWASSFR